MTAYRCKEAAENLPLALWTDRPAQLSNKSSFKIFLGACSGGEAFRPVRAVVDLGGFFSVSGIEDCYLVAASLNAGFDHCPERITASPWGVQRRAR
jgi:hypothetical protein